MNSSALVDPSSQLGEREFEQVRQLIRKEAGIDLSDSKRGMVYGRLTRRLRDLGIADFGAYLRLVSQPHSSELQQFVNALTTNHTSFFREAYHFPMLAELLRNERPADGGTWRIWSSAASSGQEAYSIAMLAIETLGERPPVQILATDIDTDIIEYGRRAVYPDGDVDSISDERRSRFFLRGKGAHSGQVRVKPAVTALVRYGRVNLISDDWPALGLFDVIFCRNVMIYFDKPTCRSLAEKFHRHLNPKGWLFIGHSESLGDSRRLFELQGRMAYRRVD